MGITEIWLNSNIPDGSVSIHGFNLVRQDRIGQRRGGVCAFVKSTIPFETLHDLSCSDHECLWVKLQPYRLPREFSCIIVGVIYHSPLADNNKLYDYLITSLDKALTSFSTAGAILMGDFNEFDYKRLCRNTSLKQIVKKPTRGDATLDLMLTNMKRWYNDHEILPAISQSDHMLVLLLPSGQLRRSNTITKAWIRKRKPSNVQAFGQFLSKLNWSVFSYLPSCQITCDMFYNVIMGLDTFFQRQNLDYS